MLEKLFKLREHGTTARTELVAGLTTFLTMSYIIFVNPDILSSTGMDRNAVFVATCLAAALGSLVMALIANWPIGMAPGMGLNAFFAFTVVKTMGYTWEQALGAVFISGVIFLILTISGIRVWLVKGIPHSLRSAIAAGIGLFLAIIALSNAGIVVAHPATKVTLGNLTEPGPLFATSAAQEGYAHGLLLVGDEDGGANHQVVSMADVAKALNLPAGTPQDPRAVAKPPLPTVTALVETVPVASYGDAADDPAIWAHPTDPAKSLIVATDKKAGMAVYDMQGKLLQFRADGKMNNTDLRDGFALGGKQVTLVTASDRTHKSVAIYRLDPDKRELVDVADGIQATGMADPYGLCMYRSAKTAKTYVFINTGDGLMRQWELLDAGDSRVRIRQVREFHLASQAEGCVADDDAGALYVGEEDVALWRMSAEPDGGDAMTAVDRVADNKALKDDLEGVGIYDLGGGRGYIVVSSQGNNTYAVYRRDGDHAYLGSFAAVADGARGIDGISETDGLDVTSRNLGPGFEHGAMITQDGRNVLPTQNQNYKYVPWESIAKALKLEMR